MSYAEIANKIKNDLEESIKSGVKTFDSFEERIDEICNEIMIKEGMLDQDIYSAITTLKSLKFPNGMPVCEYFDAFPYHKCVRLFCRPSDILFLNIKEAFDNNNEDKIQSDFQKTIKVNGIEYKLKDALDNYSEREKELEDIATSLMEEHIKNIEKAL